ncbi:hypothetical protein H8S37_04430 [Mediterraneibacter sp. NSJ-55]|uniref:Uncharacterized protein n=1 Tax=Mediterraneibacter hominis TaxID=2763054 RepID=A0A923LGA3_9FIRM|nr:hypothetical protein [Mediterraneibacter hominis]MBC5688180.1 hypothetical protein [Mediterraneibacter hominis]
MMKYIEKVGNIKVYAEKNAERDYTITFINCTDIVVQEVYFTNDIQFAIDDLFLKAFDIYTEEYIFLCIQGAEQLTKNTYRIGEKDYFCRIDDTRFFKHFCKSADEFITDKNGMRIIDR